MREHQIHEIVMNDAKNQHDKFEFLAVQLTHKLPRTLQNINNVTMSMTSLRKMHEGCMENVLMSMRTSVDSPL